MKILTVSLFKLIPPRGCAYVEFVDRRTAAKCLERMKDGYRLDNQSIKVAWATNKGINKERWVKTYWNVELGCTFIPWQDLDEMSSVEFVKWAEGGLVDEDSIPESYSAVYKRQMLALANSDVKSSDDSKLETSQVSETRPADQGNDMELGSDDEKSNELNFSMNKPAQISIEAPNVNKQNQMQFLSHIPTSQMQHFQSAIAHFQQINPPNTQQQPPQQLPLTQQPPPQAAAPTSASFSNLVNPNNQTKQILSLINSNPGANSVSPINPLLPTGPVISNMGFVDLIRGQQNLDWTHRPNQPPNHQFVQHFQLVQRPVIMTRPVLGNIGILPPQNPPPNNDLNALASMLNPAQSATQIMALGLQMRNVPNNQPIIVPQLINKVNLN